MKPSIPKGTRDFNSEEIFKKRYIINILQSEYEKFGFYPIETPSLENLSTLINKYGEEGNYLIFKILNSGDFLKNINNNSNSTIWTSQNILNKISKKALRYDLTVPLTRYIAMNYSKIYFPFKRYQIQPVWRADRPQKGRFREFYQCDADIIGSNSIYTEIDLILLCDNIFSKLKLPVIIYLNHRQILSSISEILGINQQTKQFIINLDKIDKIGEEEVIKNIIKQGIKKESLSLLKLIFKLKNIKDNKTSLDELSKILKVSKKATKAIKEIILILNHIKEIKLNNSSIKLDYTLARGLNYYTGIIFEIKSKNKKINIGSIGGGGRYDNLIKLYNKKEISGIGMSLGLDRIYLNMEELKLFPMFVNHRNNNLFFINYGEYESLIALKIIQKLRKINKNCELYPQKDKLHKQLKYATKNNYNYIAFLGKNEIENQEIKIKNFFSKELKIYKWNNDFTILF